MNVNNMHQLCENVKAQYWESFSSGDTWNYFQLPPKHVGGDAWCTTEKWKAVAVDCLQNEVNVLQSLEVLLKLDFEKYFTLANDMVVAWYDNGAHDAYRYFDILSSFPKGHKIREKFLGECEFEELLTLDDYGVNSIARTALIRNDDEKFKQCLGAWIDKKIQARAKDDVVEYEILPKLIEFGMDSNKYISSQSMQYVKSFVCSYLDHDRKHVEKILNGFESVGRAVWVADNIGYLSWSVGWDDILSTLKSSDWYWLVMFSDLWDDENNNNLLVWAMIHNDSIIGRRAHKIMEVGGMNSIDGAIAWERFSAFSRENVNCSV